MDSLPSDIFTSEMITHLSNANILQLSSVSKDILNILSDNRYNIIMPIIRDNKYDTVLDDKYINKIEFIGNDLNMLANSFPNLHTLQFGRNFNQNINALARWPVGPLVCWPVGPLVNSSPNLYALCIRCFFDRNMDPFSKRNIEILKY